MITKPKIKIFEENELSSELRNTKVSNRTIDFDIDVIDSCIFENVIFDNVRINSILDAEFHNCDLSNIILNKKNVTRASFKNSRLVGTSFSEGYLKDVIFDNCNCGYLNLVKAKLKNIRFSNTSLNSSYFQNTELNSVEFKNVTLEYAEINLTPLKDIDISGCDLSLAKFDLASIRGSIIDPSQAMDLVRLLHVRFKE